MSDTSSGWSTSEDDSSGNEYSLKTRKDKLEEMSAERKVHKRSKKKKKRKKKKKKSKKSKREKHEHYSKEEEEQSHDDVDREKGGSSTTVTSTKTVVETSVQKECIKTEPEKKSKSKKRSRSRSLPKESKRCGERSTSPDKRKTKAERNSQDKKCNLRDKSPERKFLVKSESPESKSRAKSKTPESHTRSRSRSPARARKRSRSQDQSCNDNRYKDERISRRSTSRDRRSSRKERSRSRVRNRSRDRHGKRSHSRDERKRSKSRSRDRKRSRSRSRERRKLSRSRSHEKRQKSRSRSRERRRTRSRSCDRRRGRSRSRDRKRKCNNRSPSPKKSDSRMKEPEKPKAPTAWDVRTPQVPVVLEANKMISINSRIERLETITTTDEKDTFSSSTLINKQSIEIKLPPPVPIGKSKEDPKSAVYGKWEPFQPQTNVSTVGKSTNANLNKFMRMCHEISAKEGEDDTEKGRKGEEKNVHHPFAVKEAPLYTPPHMRPRKESVPTNPAQAILQGSLNSLTETAPTGPLESIFPVSSGTDHQTKYNETRTDENAGENTLVYEKKEPEEEINVSAVIARRLGAQQILAVNPSDYSAQLVLTECDQKLKQWSTNKSKPGKFTGEVTQTKMNKRNMFQTQPSVPVLTKDFFHNLRPVTGGIGMKMLQSMGWKEGEPLGKSKEGFVVPIAVDLKVGRQGLYAEDEMPRQFPQQYQTPRSMGQMIVQPPRRRPTPIVCINGKHPVSALAEHCSKCKMGIPEYSVVAETGQIHGKMFMMNVIVENVAYQPTEPSPNKKHAKAMAATVALKSLNLMPADA